jgi:hypothetical protein
VLGFSGDLYRLLALGLWNATMALSEKVLYHGFFTSSSALLLYKRIFETWNISERIHSLNCLSPTLFNKLKLKN